MSNPLPASPAPAVLPALMEIVEAPGLFADALLTDERGGLMFLSLWGRDTAAQELLARMSLSIEEGGIRSLHVNTAEGAMIVHLDRVSSLDRHSLRIPPRNLFGDLVQLWIYDRLAVEPDRANRRALLLFRPDEDADQTVDYRLWSLVREVCHLPLLDGWRDTILSVLEMNRWMQRIDGRGVAAWHLNLGDPTLEAEVSRRIRNREIGLSNTELAAAHNARRTVAA